MIIKTPNGNIELAITEPKQPKNITAIICHPHPLFGGTMQNKVVTTLTKIANKSGAIAIRFNFRGVGSSEGEYADGIGEQDDLLSVIDHAKQQYPDNELWLAGFSFGAFVATKVAEKIQPTLLITVAPPVNHFPFNQVKINNKWLLAQGDLDDVVPANEVYAWAEQQTPKPSIIKFPDAGHFFHGKLVDLQDGLLSNISCIHT